jgi:hypothetical protein
MGFAYVTTYIRQVHNLAQSIALDINTIAMLVSLVLIPVLGALLDHVGRKRILTLHRAAALARPAPVASGKLFFGRLGSNGVGHGPSPDFLAVPRI